MISATSPVHYPIYFEVLFLFSLRHLKHFAWSTKYHISQLDEQPAQGCAKHFMKTLFCEIKHTVPYY